jgi:hypothetical protein
VNTHAVAPATPITTPVTRTVSVALGIILAASIGLWIAFAIGEIRAPAADAQGTNAFSTQVYAELSAPRAFSTQDYAAQHAAPVVAQAFSTQDYADQRD